MRKPNVAKQLPARMQRMQRMRRAHGDDQCDVQCVDAPKVNASRKAAKPPEVVHGATDVFRVLGDPTRLRIVDALTRHELCVCDLALIVNASQSTVSHSLRALRQLRLVKHRKEGKVAFYSLEDQHIAALLATVYEHVSEE